MTTCDCISHTCKFGVAFIVHWLFNPEYIRIDVWNWWSTPLICWRCFFFTNHTITMSSISFPQGRYTRRTDGDRAVPGGLGHSSGQQLQHHSDPLRRPRQWLSGHQPSPQSQEKAGNFRGEGPAGGPQVRPLPELRAWLRRRASWFLSFNLLSYICRFISKKPYIDKNRMGVYGKVRGTQQCSKGLPSFWFQLAACLHRDTVAVLNVK